MSQKEVIFTNKMLLHDWYENFDGTIFPKQPVTFAETVPENWGIFHLIIQYAWSCCQGNLFYLLDVSSL